MMVMYLKQLLKTLITQTLHEGRESTSRAMNRIETLAKVVVLEGN